MMTLVVFVVGWFSAGLVVTDPADVEAVTKGITVTSTATDRALGLAVRAAGGVGAVMLYRRLR